ncbi:hypothetical protein CRG98_020578 [Punica granatum]|uniref:F-box domain-containing protein n=1 Tax=Punica granatum TaxID=22663 RepID=A0A2I0JSZ1_PUNGR|nr:hypothetical protein CRG98_020578 [Punica granatum]
MLDRSLFHGGPERPASSELSFLNGGDFFGKKIYSNPFSAGGSRERLLDRLVLSREMESTLVIKEPSSRNWLELPWDITAAILQRIGVIDILSNAQWVCTQWWSICKEPSMWRTIDMRSGCHHCEWEKYGYLENMCRHAVDRSCGGLVDISILSFGTDELLTHIAVRTWSSLTARCPWKTLEAVGRHCPHLKSLKFNNNDRYSYPRIEVDEEARAIAKTMPELRQLQLVGNILTNVGLEAILDGCPHLEFLDLRQCLKHRPRSQVGEAMCRADQGFKAALGLNPLLCTPRAA